MNSVPTQATPASSSLDDDEQTVVLQNSPELRQFLATCFSNIGELETERSSTNSTITSIYAKIKERGIPRDAFDMVKKVMGWDQQKRMAFDIAYAIARQAGNVPLQTDLFESVNQPHIVSVPDDPDLDPNAPQPRMPDGDAGPFSWSRQEGTSDGN